MNMQSKIQQVNWEDELKNCPKCGYRDGFHTMLKREKGGVLLHLICPSCHDVFDPGIVLEHPQTVHKHE